jgi:hypothetical protein
MDIVELKTQRATRRAASLAKQRAEYQKRSLVLCHPDRSAAAAPVGRDHVKPNRMVRAARRNYLACGAVESSSDLPQISTGRVGTWSRWVRKPSVAPMLTGCVVPDEEMVWSGDVDFESYSPKCAVDTEIDEGSTTDPESLESCIEDTSSADERFDVKLDENVHSVGYSANATSKMEETDASGSVTISARGTQENITQSVEEPTDSTAHQPSVEGDVAQEMPQAQTEMKLLHEPSPSEAEELEAQALRKKAQEDAYAIKKQAVAEAVAIRLRAELEAKAKMEELSRQQQASEEARLQAELQAKELAAVEAEQQARLKAQRESAADLRRAINWSSSVRRHSGKKKSMCEELRQTRSVLKRRRSHMHNESSSLPKRRLPPFETQPKQMRASLR